MAWFKGKATAGGQPSAKQLDLNEVRRALLLFADPGGEVELRSLKPNRSAVRLGSDIDGLVEQAACLSAARALYFCLNPVSLGAPSERSASDSDVTRYRWLFIDIDSLRPDPKESCSTNEEKESAKAVALAVEQSLSSSGWPEPVLVDSGNGYYLLYRIDEPANEETQCVLRRFLHRLHDQHPAANIDRAVHNRSRIIRLPGSWNRKGPDSPARPHRMARVLSVPTQLVVVSRELLESSAAPVPEKEHHPGNGKSREREWFRGKSSDSRLASYARRALEREILNVAFAVRGSQGGHGANNTLNEAAFALGTMASWGVLDETECRSMLAEAARRVGLEEDEIGPTIESGYESGRMQPRKYPDWHTNGNGSRNGKQDIPQNLIPATNTEPSWSFLLDGEVIVEGSPDRIIESLGDSKEDEDGRNGRVYEMCTIGHIANTTYPEPVWVVPGIMSEGLNILAGAPKQGKSMMALNLALTIAGGGLALGGIRVDIGDVLYLSLEDKFRRVKERAAKMLRTISPNLVGEVANRLTIATDWPKMDEGGLRYIDLWAARAARPVLVIIDVWNRFCPTQRGNASAYGQDADAMSRVKKYVDKVGISSTVIHHTRKPGMKEPEDFVHEVSGTMGLSGAADGILVLTRSRNDNQASLHITGRDVAETELVVEFDKQNLTWKSLGTKGEHSDGRVKSKVLDYLKSNRPTAFFPKDIADALEEKQDSVRQVLFRLFRDKIIRKVGNGYAYPGEDEGEM